MSKYSTVKPQGINHMRWASHRIASLKKIFGNFSVMQYGRSCDLCIEVTYHEMNMFKASSS